jgi:predicted transcriptional regulator
VRHPGSIYELAKSVKRDLENVQRDLRTLEAYGLVRTTAARRTGNRRARAPEAPFDEIVPRITIQDGGARRASQGRRPPPCRRFSY